MGRGTYAHALGAKPEAAEVWLDCVAADRGFAVGDRVRIDMAHGPHYPGMALWVSATHFGFSGSDSPNIFQKGTGNYGIITANRWRFLVRLYR